MSQTPLFLVDQYQSANATRVHNCVTDYIAYFPCYHKQGPVRIQMIPHLVGTRVDGSSAHWHHN
jgi:hypothetical protein